MTPAVVTALAILSPRRRPQPKARARCAGRRPAVRARGRGCRQRRPAARGTPTCSRQAAGATAVTAADVDGDSTSLCAYRGGPGSSFFDVLRLNAWRCADNSSSADVDLPAGARVVAARLYVETSAPRRTSARSGWRSTGLARASTTDSGLGPARRHPPPRPPGSSTTTTTTITTTATSRPRRPTPRSPPRPPRRPRLRRHRRRPSRRSCTRRSAATGDGAALRQAVWDLTGYVAADGRRHLHRRRHRQRAGRAVAAVRLVGDRRRLRARPAVGLDGIAPSNSTGSPPGSSRGTTASSTSMPDRSTSRSTASTPRPAPTFGKTIHVVAHGRRGRSDNLLFDDGPLGNNNSPGDAPAPAGVVLGHRPVLQHRDRRPERHDLRARHERRHQVAGRGRLPLVRRRQDAVVRLGRRHRRHPHPRPATSAPPVREASSASSSPAATRWRPA